MRSGGKNFNYFP